MSEPAILVWSGREYIKESCQMTIKPMLVLCVLVTATTTASTGCSSHVEKPDLSIPKTLTRVEATFAAGTVRGVEEQGVLAFYGVPYAAPVGGLDRFLPPKDAAPFEGVVDATSYGQACAQVEAVMPS